MAVASLVLGVLAVLLCWVPILGAALAITALVISIVAICGKGARGDNPAFKVVGLVLSILSTLIAVFMTLALVTGVTFVVNFVDGVFGDNLGFFASFDTNDLAEDLLTEHTKIRMEISIGMSTNRKKEAVLKRYMEILEKKYPELYEEGYTIEVEDDLMFKIVEPKK